MYGHGVGHVQLRQLVGGVDGGAVVKADGQQLAGGVDVLDDAHVAVENAAAHGAVVLRPQHIVVVAGLHDPITGAEHHVAPLLLPLITDGRVQRRLQGAVEVHSAALALAGGGQHLDLPRLHAHASGQAVAAQLHHRLHQTVR